MASTSRLRHILSYAALSLPLVFMLFFFFYPLAAILARSVTLTRSPALLEMRYLLRILWFTTWQAALSTALTLILGLPGAHVLARYRFPGKWLLEALFTIPFVLPALVVAPAFLSLFGPTGIINTALVQLLNLARPPLDLQHTIWLVLLAHVFYNYSVVLRVVGSFWGSLDPRLDEAARVLGASPWRAWWKVVLPQLAPAVAAAAMLVFLFTFTSFGVMLILGGPRFATLEVEIYRQAVHSLNLPRAALLSIIQLALTFGLMSAYTRLQLKTSRPLEYRSAQAAEAPVRSGTDRLWVYGNLAWMVALLLVPLAALAWRSLTLGGTLTLRHYLALWQNPDRSIFFTAPTTAIRNSLLFATATVLLSVILGTLGAYLLTSRDRRIAPLLAWLDPLLVLPLGASSVTLGFGYLIAFSQPPFNWITLPFMIPLAHTLIAFPFVLRSVLPALRRIQPSIREAAAVLGAPPGRVWWAIDLGLIARPLVAGAVFAFTISIGEFGATLLIARTEYATIPIVLYRHLSQPGLTNLGQALAMSVILMIISALGFVLIERFQDRLGAF